LEVVESKGSTLASEVRKSYYFRGTDDTIKGIIDGFSPEEIKILQEDGNMAKELEQLRASVDEWVIEKDLFVKAIKKVTGEPEEEDEEDEEESDHDGG
jgi:hypothetical protein